MTRIRRLPDWEISEICAWVLPVSGYEEGNIVQNATNEKIVPIISNIR